MSKANFIEEELLARLLGVDREKTRAARPASHQRHSNAVVWPIKDARAFATSLGLALPDAPEDAGDEVVTVQSCPGPGGFHFGAHLIKARRGNGEVVNVRVMDSSKFRPQLGNGEPMQFRAHKSEDGPHWLLTGREPRWPGIW